jgi:FAD:protein FMN transferase
MTRLVTIFAAALLASCSRGPVQTKFEGSSLGTTWHLTLVGRSDEVKAAVQGRLDELDLAFTNWRESPVTRFNASRSGEWQAVPRELAEMVLFARQLSEHTEGAFDITVAPLVKIWGFGTAGRVKTPPAEEAIQRAMEHVGWRKLEARLDPPALRKVDPEIVINVSAMADGYACDDIAKLLRARGIDNFLLEIGGAVLASGSNAEHKTWQAGIQRPDGAAGRTVQTLPLRNQAVSTSGVYRQYFESDGQRYAHVLDARTGRPITHGLVSVSVVHDSAFAADGWDTALLILGPDEGRALAKKLGLNALFLAEAP